MDALLYILRTGCQWRNLPSCFPHWQAVYWYFSQWKKQNVIEQINRAVNKIDRVNTHRDKNPSILCIDSQSVKLSPMICELHGTDSNKKGNDILIYTDLKIKKSPLM